MKRSRQREKIPRYMSPTESNSAEPKAYFVHNTKDLRTIPTHAGDIDAWNKIANKRESYGGRYAKGSHYHLAASSQAGFPFL